jgi:outer membrane protein W
MKMTTFVRSSALAVALAAATGHPGSAQMPVEAELAPFVGGSFFLSDARAPLIVSRQGGAQTIVQDGELRNAPTVGFSAGLRLADRFGLEGMFAWVPTRLIGEATIPQRRRVADVNALRYGVSLLYHLDELGAARPFVGVALASETMSYEPHLTRARETETAGALTLGAHLPLSNRIALRLQALQDVIGRSERSRREQLMVTAGLSYRQPLR